MINEVNKQRWLASYYVYAQQFEEWVDQKLQTCAPVEFDDAWVLFSTQCYDSFKAIQAEYEESEWENDEWGELFNFMWEMKMHTYTPLSNRWKVEWHQRQIK